jgi:hypothetical protein
MIRRVLGSERIVMLNVRLVMGNSSTMICLCFVIHLYNMRNQAHVDNVIITSKYAALLTWAKALRFPSIFCSLLSLISCRSVGEEDISLYHAV